MSVASTQPTRKKGTVFPRMNSQRRMGVTIICSSVPISRSRTTAKAVSIMTRISMTLPMTPGTKYHWLSSPSLNHGRTLEVHLGEERHQLRRGAPHAVELIVAAELRADLVEIAQRHQRGVRVGAVHQHLHRGALAIAQALGEAGIDFQRRQEVAAVNAFAEVLPPRGMFFEMEITAGGKTGDQLAALLRVVQVEHGQFHVPHIQRGRVPEDQHLDDRRAEQQPARMRVAQRLDELLAEHVTDARE